MIKQLQRPKPSTCNSCNHCSKHIEIVEDFFNKKHIPDVRYGFPNIVIPQKKEIEKLTCNSNKSLLGGYRVIETFGCTHHSDYSE